MDLPRMRRRIFSNRLLYLSVLLLLAPNSGYGQPAPIDLRDDFVLFEGSGGIIAAFQNDPVSYPGQRIVSQASNGVVTNYAEHHFAYAGNPGYTGSDSFVYENCWSLTVCSTATVTVFVFGSYDGQNLGACPLNLPAANVGKPVNVTNGNMWLEHRDYRLPGFGEIIEINRFYNSGSQVAGLFGIGWTTKFDESLTIYDSRMVRLNLPDGRGIFFGRKEAGDPFFSLTGGFKGEIVVNTDGSYTFTHHDGRSRRFSSAGKLLSMKDTNGNQTSLSYDTNNRLTGITDAAGRVLTLVPNADGRIAQISDSLGTLATYQYGSGTSKLESTTFPDGSKYQYEYTTVGTKTLLTTVRDALNNVLETHAYDSEGRAYTSEVDGGVEAYTVTFQVPPGAAPDSGISVVTDARGNQTKYFFARIAGSNIVTKTEGVCGCGGSGSEITQYQYDSALNLVNTIDALNRHTDYAYDADGNRIQQTDPLGTQRWTYNFLGHMLTYKDRVDQSSADNTVNNTFDSKGNLLTTTDRLGYTTTMTYTSVGQLATVTDARNNTTTFTYDTQGRLIEVTDANSKDTTFAYDARARVTSVTNALNQTTGFEYDLNNRLKKVTFADANYTENTYDLAGRRTQFRNARGHTTNFAYDGAYRLTSVTDPLNHTKIFGYDAMSNITSQTDALGNTTNLEYDDFDRLKKVIYPPATTGATRLEESVTYDKLGNVKTRVDTAGRTTAYDYDNLNRLIKITDALSNQTLFEYNLRSQMTKVKDALNQEYVFTYDPLGRILSQTRAGPTMSYEYDAVGNRTKRVDYGGRVTNYEYDALNRLTKITYVSGSPIPALDSVSTYTYDDLSRLLTAANNVGTVAFTYDNRGRLKTETDVWGKVIEYGFDAGGNRTSMKLDGASYSTYAYDDADRLTGITSVPDSTTISYGYDIADRMTSRVFPNGITTTYEFDGMSRLKRLKDVNTAGTLYDRQYAYNTANQISQIADAAQTRNFTYDNLDRLTGMTDGTNSESYSFDAVGNRTSSHLSSTYTYQALNRLMTSQTSRHGYNANGSMISKSEGPKLWTYIYDYENRLARAADRRQNVVYKYDALGRRVERNRGYGIERTKFTHDGEDVVVEDTNGTVVKYQNGPGIDNKLSVKQGSTTNYFLADHLGSTNALTDSTGAIIASQTYDSFGNGTNPAFPTRFQFTGREYDPTIGLQYSRARMYDPKLGRFTSEDPIGFAGGDVNLYGYVRNMPLWYRDPRGLQPGADVMANPGFWQAAAAAVAAAAPFVPPVAVAAGGAAAIYGASQLGVYTANHPSNPFVNGPWNPFGPPVSVRPLPPSTMSRPYCQPAPRAIPLERAPTNTWPDSEPDRDGCAEEISECVQICANAQFDPDMKNIWGGSRETCLRGCISARCQKGLRF